MDVGGFGYPFWSTLPRPFRMLFQRCRVFDLVTFTRFLTETLGIKEMNVAMLLSIDFTSLGSARGPRAKAKGPGPVPKRHY